MVGDGHTAFGGNSGCIDDYVVAYVQTLALPPKGASCNQEVPFVTPPAAAVSAMSAQSAASPAALQHQLRLHSLR